MPIDNRYGIKPNGTGMNSKAAQAVIGFATGGPVGLTMALAPDSAGKKAFGMYQTAKGLMGTSAPSPTQGMPELQKPEMGGQEASAYGKARQPSLMGGANPMERRLSIMQQSPNFAAQSALRDLDQLSLSPEVKAQLAAPLVQSQVWGSRAPMGRSY